MAKKSLFVSMLIGCVGFASLAVAQDGGLSFNSRFTTKAPTIDGVLSSGEWGNALKIRVDATDEVPPGVVSADSGPIVPPGLQPIEDFNATIYVMNNATHLFIAIDVNDDVLIFSKADLWRNDSAEIRIDSNFSRSNPKEGVPNGYSANVRGDNGAQSDIPPGAEVVASVKPLNNGWVLEFSVPIAGYAPTIGFDVAINDSDTTETLNRDSQIRINALSDDAWQDETEWARLTLATQSNAKHWELMD